MVIETVAIVGVGLIGGSFALALRKAGFGGRVLGVSSPRTVEAALERGVIDEAQPRGIISLIWAAKARWRTAHW